MAEISTKENLINDDANDDEQIPLEKPVIGKQPIKKEHIKIIISNLINFRIFLLL